MKTICGRCNGSVTTHTMSVSGSCACDTCCGAGYLGTDLKTLEQHNAERSKVYRDFQAAQKTHPNGIACPKCNKELWDSCPTVTLSSNPPQKNIHCPACGFIGFRLS